MAEVGVASTYMVSYVGQDVKARHLYHGQRAIDSQKEKSKETVMNRVTTENSSTHTNTHTQQATKPISLHNRLLHFENSASLTTKTQATEKSTIVCLSVLNSSQQLQNDNTKDCLTPNTLIAAQNTTSESLKHIVI